MKRLQRYNIRKNFNANFTKTLTQTSKTFDLGHVGSMGIAHNEYLEDGEHALYEVSSQSVKRLQRYNIRENFNANPDARMDGRTYAKVPTISRYPQAARQ